MGGLHLSGSYSNHRLNSDLKSNFQAHTIRSALRTSTSAC